MTTFGLKNAEIAQHVRAVARDDLDAEELFDRFARAAWSGIAEPGDRAAGVLVGMLGAASALDAVIARTSVDAIVERVSGELTPAETTEAIARWQPRLQARTTIIALKQAARYGVRLVVPSDTVWPAGLDDLGPHAPIALWLRGNESTLATTQSSIALVGARAATGYGEHVTMEASAGLVDRGYTIVSGAAYGIDGMAHRAALASSGQTIAVLAGGVDRFYPSGHEALLTRIVDDGAVVSELPCGAAPTKWRFLQRNRLIAAMSLATVVLEAGWRSGSLNTAGHASALGRPLGAVPGPVTSAASSGCHRLIREFDAICVTSPEEMAELAPLERHPLTTQNTDVPLRGPDSDQVRLRDAMSNRAARPVVDLAARSGLSVARVQSMLGTMELEGRAAEREAGWVRL